MQSKSLESRPWVVAALCVAALAVTWLCYFVVHDALPEAAWAAHWGLFTLALGSTAGLLITFERIVPYLAVRAGGKHRPLN